MRAPMFESAEVDIVSNVDESEDMETNEAKVVGNNEPLRTKMESVR